MLPFAPPPDPLLVSPEFVESAGAAPEAPSDRQDNLAEPYPQRGSSTGSEKALDQKLNEKKPS